MLVIGEAVRHYNAYAIQCYSRDGVPSGEHVTIRAALLPLVARYSELQVTDFGPKKLRQVREDMIALDWSRRSMNKAVSVIKR